MRSPAEATDGVAGITFDRSERGVECRATHRVVDDIESLAARILGDILLRANRTIVNGGRSPLLNNGLFTMRNGGKHFRSARLRKLYGNVTYATRAGMDQNGLPGVYPGPVYQAFPRGDGDKGQGRGLPHRQALWFKSQQISIGQHVLRQRAWYASDAGNHTVHVFAR